MLDDQTQSLICTIVEIEGISMSTSEQDPLKMILNNKRSKTKQTKRITKGDDSKRNP